MIQGLSKLKELLLLYKYKDITEATISSDSVIQLNQQMSSILEWKFNICGWPSTIIRLNASLHT